MKLEKRSRATVTPTRNPPPLPTTSPTSSTPPAPPENPKASRSHTAASRTTCAWCVAAYRRPVGRGRARSVDALSFDLTVTSLLLLSPRDGASACSPPTSGIERPRRPAPRAPRGLLARQDHARSHLDLLASRAVSGGASLVRPAPSSSAARRSRPSPWTASARRGPGRRLQRVRADRNGRGLLRLGVRRAPARAPVPIGRPIANVRALRPRRAASQPVPSACRASSTSGAGRRRAATATAPA